MGVSGLGGKRDNKCQSDNGWGVQEKSFRTLTCAKRISGKQAQTQTTGSWAW